MTDRIEKVIELSASVARVWRALTDHKEFGIWFRVELEGPFVVGQISRGRTTYPGYEGMKWEATIVAMEPERLFAFKWCPYEHEDERDLSQAPQTLVEFRIEPTSTGTRLVISESGFDALPDDKRRLDALRSNTQGWEQQMRSLATYAET
jgi:uncharacterized protein YndB with AHSA1/START domain